MLHERHSPAHASTRPSPLPLAAHGKIWPLATNGSWSDRLVAICRAAPFPRGLPRGEGPIHRRSSALRLYVGSSAAHIAARTRRLVSVWQECDLLVMETRLGPSASRTGPVSVAHHDRVPWRGIMPLPMSISNFGQSPAAIKKYCPAMGGLG